MSLPDVSTNKPADPMERVNFCWKSITVTVQTKWRQKHEPKVILDDVSGYIKEGELMAVMGPSAAGKSTLFNVLTFRNLAGLEMVGHRYANGMEMKKRSAMSSIVGYVPQFDLYIGTLTVREHLVFLSKLKLGECTKRQREEKIEELMKQLGLKKCESTLIGATGGRKGISGGEKRRLAFASEVMSDPPLLLCDEPTSGLDSWMAENLVGYMKNMTQKGKTILCVIHQPSSELYHLFDRVLLLVGGRTAFMGDVHEAKHFFDGIDYPCPDTFNPADHYIHKLSMIPKHESEYHERVNLICDAYQESDYATKVIHEVNEQIHHGSESGSTRKLKPYKASWMGQFTALLVRAWQALIQDSIIQWIKLYQYVALGIMVGVIYLDQDYDQIGAANINGVLFWLTITNIINPYTNALGIFSRQIPVLMRENNNGLYRVDTYFVAANLVELPFDIILSSILMVFMYFMIDLNNEVKSFFYLIIINALMVQSGIALAVTVASLSPNADIALAIGPTVAVPLYCLAGYYLNLDSMADYVAWARYISPYFYTNEGLYIAQWEDVEKITCDDEDITQCQFHNGQEVLDFYHYNDSFWFDAGMLFAMAIGFRFLGMIVLFWKAARNR